jgi:hypothetical protein
MATTTNSLTRRRRGRRRGGGEGAGGQEDDQGRKRKKETKEIERIGVDDVIYIVFTLIFGESNALCVRYTRV